MINKSSFYSLFIIFLISILTVGCATIFKGSDADIRVNSQPSNASVFINESIVEVHPKPSHSEEMKTIY